MPMLATGSRYYLVRFIFVAAASAAAVALGFLLLPLGGSATLMWPPSAVGIAVLFLYGYDLWPAITLSIFAVLFFRNGNLPLDISIAIADTIEAFVGAYFLRRYVELNPMLARLRDSMGLLVACIAPTFLSAIIISVTSYFFGFYSLTDIEPMFVAVWIGHAVSALSFSPFLIRWLYRPMFTKTKDELIEGAIIFGGITASVYFSFWTMHTSVGPISFVYILLILLIWASMRTGPRGTTLGLAIVAALGTGGLVFGHGALSLSANPQVNLGVQVLLGALDILFLLFTSTVEERKEAIITLEQNVGQLESAIEKIRSEDQAKTNFLAILAHELRNPLAPIVSSVELMKSDPTIQTDPALIETIETHAHTISLLLDDLLDVSRITQNKFELHRKKLLLSSSVEHALESVKPFIHSRGHTLEVTLPQEELFLDADPVRFEQILVNLLNNAGKYTDTGNGRITLVCSREGRFAVIRVADNGIGIAPEKLLGVFEPFGQRGAVLRTPGGLGIGLSLTKQLAELHGGVVEAHSEGLGAGSTFTVRMPLSSAPEKPSVAPFSFVNRLRNRSTSTLHKIILVVDDNEPAAKGLIALLNRQGHKAHMALTGADAIEKVQQLKPEVVILDIGLPDMNGYEVAKKIRALAVRPRKLIALTGYGQEDDKAKSADAGFDAHLTKPVSLADVEEVL
jgi:signal transduction histidine kinase